MLIGTSEGVTRCYAAKRMPEEEGWNVDEIKKDERYPTAAESTASGAAHTH